MYHGGVLKQYGRPGHKGFIKIKDQRTERGQYLSQNNQERIEFLRNMKDKLEMDFLLAKGSLQLFNDTGDQRTLLFSYEKPDGLGGKKRGLPDYLLQHLEIWPGAYIPQNLHFLFIPRNNYSGHVSNESYPSRDRSNGAHFGYRMPGKRLEFWGDRLHELSIDEKNDMIKAFILFDMEVKTSEPPVALEREWVWGDEASDKSPNQINELLDRRKRERGAELLSSDWRSSATPSNRGTCKLERSLERETCVDQRFKPLSARPVLKLTPKKEQFVDQRFKPLSARPVLKLTPKKKEKEILEQIFKLPTEIPVLKLEPEKEKEKKLSKKKNKSKSKGKNKNKNKSKSVTTLEEPTFD